MLLAYTSKFNLDFCTLHFSCPHFLSSITVTTLLLEITDLRLIRLNVYSLGPTANTVSDAGETLYTVSQKKVNKNVFVISSTKLGEFW